MSTRASARSEKVEQWARDVSRNSPSPGRSPRKVPECKRCGRPRKNHPRSGCPHADPPIPSSVGGRSKDQTHQLTDDMEALAINSRPKSRGKRYSGTPRELVTETSEELVFGPAPSPPAPDGQGHDRSDGDDRARGDTRPNSPAPELSQSPSQRSTLSRSVSQDEHATLFQSLLKNPGAFVVKHEKEGMPAFLRYLTKAGYTATVVSSVDEDAQLVAVGKDAQLVRQVGRIGSRQAEAVDAACDHLAQKGGFPALVACTGAGVAVGAVATWTGLAFG
ncbi:hypothetical protein FOMPIDRAFT_1024497 [Fomitopsis schrenkii]|uniref:Uncharacterized protein n=1 Tax=Fomitopsis schrenkii TaxID=2126942 RepID=S8E0R8_FOMSC|nr:hypothetical protein FOMPIDRAFT_1024497 [Fomitopsis schrenkii]